MALVEATRAYENGNFDEVLRQIAPCLQAPLSTREKVAIFRLMAMTHLAMDHFGDARTYVLRLLAVKSNYETTLQDPASFARLVEDVKLDLSRVQVSSVSKLNESIFEAPATVLVIAEADIRRRGYTDLEQVFHDVPGFDISRGNGVQYSLLYQRGYRSNGTDKTLFLIDGVEENDLWTNFTELSRQYPLSNIRSIEIIYGPASTMYGANAFLGVVNILTKEPSAYVDRNRAFGFQAQASGGGWNTRYVDATVAARYEDFAVSVTGRVFRSDEMDLSAFPEWDFQARDVPYYQDKLSVRGLDERGRFRAEGFLENNPGAVNNPYVQIARDEAGRPTAIEVTEAGAQAAQAYDQAALAERVGGHPVRYANDTDNWFLHAKLRSGGFSFGLQTWRRNEGTIGWFIDDREGPSRNGGVWIPRNAFLYMKYDKPITEHVFMTVFTQYKSHSLDRDNRILIFRSYAGEGRWGLEQLLSDTPSRWSQLWFYQLSKELRVETKMLYVPSERFNVVSGVEARNGHIQGNYVTSIEPHPSETGNHTAQVGGNHFEHRDFGFYTQASYKPAQKVKLVLGGRVDNNRIRDTQGYGTVFNSRAAAVISPGDYVVKAVYSEAFKAASNWAKYATSPSRGIPNPNLDPERVRNYEVNVGRQKGRVSGDVGGYWASYTDVVGTARITLPDGATTTQNQAIGRLRIRGLQANASWKPGRFEVWGNYTYTDPVNVEPRDNEGNLIVDAQGRVQPIRIGDIAAHRVNVGANALFRDRLNVGARLNWVGERKTGKETTIFDNPLDRIEAYWVLHGAATYQNFLPGISAQVVVNNVLDRAHFHPGARSADGKILASRFPQNRRQVMLRVFADF